jgi:hypothetical protein
MDKPAIHAGQCFCGAVKFETSGTPVAMGYCHCDSCRHWSASPVNAFTLWSPDSVKITQGLAFVGTYQKTPRSIRKWCTACGGHVLAEHPAMGVVDVYAALLPTLAFEAGVHVNYAECVLRLHDGKPKFSDMPAEMGGSGQQLAA